MASVNPTSRVRRGMVFWYDPTSAYIPGGAKKAGSKPEGRMSGHIQNKLRPHLVISNDIANFTSPVVNMVPISGSNDKGPLPCQVHFINWNGQPNVVLVEQVLTANISDLKEYICSLSPATMERVDRAIVTQLLCDKLPSAVNPIDISLSDLERRLNNLLDQVVEAAKQKMEAQAKAIRLTSDKVDEITLNMATTIQSLIDAPLPAVPSADIAVEPEPETPVEETPSTPAPIAEAVQEAPKTVKKTGRQTATERFNARWGMSSQAPEQKVEQALEPEPPIVMTGRHGRPTSWTPERRAAFLRDFETMSPDDLCQKYHIDSKSKLFSRKYQNKVWLENHGINYQTCGVK